MKSALFLAIGRPGNKERHSSAQDVGRSSEEEVDGPIANTKPPHHRRKEVVESIRTCHENVHEDEDLPPDQLWGRELVFSSILTYVLTSVRARRKPCQTVDSVCASTRSAWMRVTAILRISSVNIHIWPPDVVCG